MEQSAELTTAENNILPQTANSKSFSMDQLSSLAATICFLLSGLHLLLNAICLPISALNFLMILPTAILHQNLKFLLLLQSLTISCFSAFELVRTVQKFCTSNFFQWDPLARLMLSLSLLCMLFIDWLSFCLLAERILATIKSRNYEWDKRPHFIILCFLFMCLATFFCFWTGVDFDQRTGIHPSLLTLFEIYSSLGLSFLCMMICPFLWKFNKWKYKKLTISRNSRNNYATELSLKYQLSENIRTNRQLLPSGIFHFFNVFLTISFAFQAYYGVVVWNAGWNVLCVLAIFLLYSASNICIQISIIIMHPFLNRKLWKFIFAIKSTFRRPRIGNMENQIVAQRNDEPVDIFGNELIQRRNSQMQEHFRLLEKYWN